MRKGKSILKQIGIMLLAFMLSYTMITAVMPVMSVEAKEWTKSSVKKEITKTTNRIKNVKEKYFNAEKEYKALKKEIQNDERGLISFGIAGASVVSGNPLIVYYGNQYYYIRNQTTLLERHWGSYRATGEYSVYNGWSCIVLEYVEIDKAKYSRLNKLAAKIKKYDSKWQDLVDKRYDLKQALKNQSFIEAEEVYNEYNDGREYLPVGDEFDLSKCAYWSYADENYSYAIYTSSDDSIASVDKYDGILKTKCDGVVTITMKNSVSGKKSNVKLVIKRDMDNTSVGDLSVE